MQLLLDYLSTILSDPWIIFGFIAQFIFFLRFVVQWVVSEKFERSVIPLTFWYLSIVGSFMILIYSIKREDVVFIVSCLLSIIIYTRNILLIQRRKSNIVADIPHRNCDFEEFSSIKPGLDHTVGRLSVNDCKTTRWFGYPRKAGQFVVGHVR